MSPDRGHFHHRLIDLGLSQKQAVAVLYAISGLLGFAAVVSTTSDELRALIFIITILVAAAIVFFAFRDKLKGTAPSSGNAADKQEEQEPTESDDSGAPEETDE